MSFIIVVSLSFLYFVTLYNLTCFPNKSGYVLPRLRTKFAQRGFAYAGPAAWNCLPESLRSIPSQAAFKRQLETFLFRDAFNIVYDEPWLFYIALYVCNAPMVFYYVMGALANF